MTVRVATYDDVDRIIEMRRRSYEYGGLADVAGPFDEEHFRDVFTFAAGNPGMCLRVAEVDGKVVGVIFMVLAEMWLSRSRTCATEAFIWVEPEARGHGIGAGLLANAEEWARAAGADFVGVHSHPGLDPASMRAMLASRGYAEAHTAYIRRIR